MASPVLRSSFAAIVVALGSASVAFAQVSSDWAWMLRDQSDPVHGIPASRVPTDGMLLPLGTEWFVLPSGEVGLGTKAPAHRLHVAGDAKIDGRFAAGGDGVIGPNGSWNQQFSFRDTIVDYSSASMWNLFETYLVVDPDQNITPPNEKFVWANFLGAETAAGNPNDVYSFIGSLLGAYHDSNGVTEGMLGAAVQSISKGEIGQVQIGLAVDSENFGGHGQHSLQRGDRRADRSSRHRGFCRRQLRSLRPRAVRGPAGPAEHRDLSRGPRPKRRLGLRHLRGRRTVVLPRSRRHRSGHQRRDRAALRGR